MIITLKKTATAENIENLEKILKKYGLEAHISRGSFSTIVGAVGDTRNVNADIIETLPYVEQVIRVTKPYKLVSREFKGDDTVLELDGTKIGGKYFCVMAGPCAIEDESQYLTTARKIKELGGKVLRSSIYKPRTSPNEFQGIREFGLGLIRRAKEETGLLIESEVMESRQIGILNDYVDIYRIGARNMQNFDLLKKVGKSGKPVILKRGMSATIKEWLSAAEYIMNEKNDKIILCERGIRTFETATRNTLDISAVPVIKKESHLPIIVDPSHSTGNRAYVLPMANAILAAGADGLLVDVHPEPEKAKVDGPQAITLQEFEKMMKELRKLASVLEREM